MTALWRRNSGQSTWWISITNSSCDPIHLTLHQSPLIVPSFSSNTTMKASECEDFCRRLIDNRAWGLWVRVVEWVFAVISLALIAFSFSQFKGYADYKGWVWGPIGVAFVFSPSSTVALILGRMGCSITPCSGCSRLDLSRPLV